MIEVMAYSIIHRVLIAYNLLCYYSIVIASRSFFVHEQHKHVADIIIFLWIFSNEFPGYFCFYFEWRNELLETRTFVLILK